MINRLKAAVDNHVALFDTVFVTLIHGFKTRYDNARGIQLTKKEDVTAGVITKADARLNLEKQLTINLLNLAIEFIDNPEQGWAFFNQNLLNPTHKHPQGGELKGKYVLDILTNVKTMADFKLKNETDYYLLLKNTSTELIFGYTCKDTSGNPIPITYFKLEPGASKIFSYAELGGMEYLFFYTESTEIVGQVTIEQVNAPMV